MLAVRGIQLQILNPVVCLFTVDVVNNFPWSEVAPKVRFHNQSMFTDIAADAGMGVIGSTDQYVARLIYFSPTFPVAVFFTGLGALASKERDRILMHEAPDLFRLNRQIKCFGYLAAGQSFGSQRCNLALERQQR